MYIYIHILLILSYLFCLAWCIFFQALGCFIIPGCVAQHRILPWSSPGPCQGLPLGVKGHVFFGWGLENTKLQYEVMSSKIQKNLQQEPRFTDPEKTWVSNSSIATYGVTGSVGIRFYPIVPWKNDLLLWIKGFWRWMLWGDFEVTEKHLPVLAWDVQNHM